MQIEFEHPVDTNVLHKCNDSVEMIFRNLNLLWDERNIRGLITKKVLIPETIQGFAYYTTQNQIVFPKKDSYFLPT